MTSPSPDTLEREREKLYVTDAELVRRIGLPDKDGYMLIRMFDENPAKYGFPQKSKLMSGRRYWPKVKAWFDKYEGLNPQEQRKSA